jgi:hypothetical protein
MQGVTIPGNELIAVFDADQVAKREVRTSQRRPPARM